MEEEGEGTMEERCGASADRGQEGEEGDGASADSVPCLHFPPPKFPPTLMCCI